MWPAILSIGAFAIALYELWRKPAPDSAGADGVASSPSAPALAPPRPRVPVDVATGLPPAQPATAPASAADYQRTATWSAQYLGNAMPLPERLGKLRYVVPAHMWPPFALRVWSAIVRAGGL